MSGPERWVRGPLAPWRKPATPGPNDAARRRLWWRELPLLAVVPVLLGVMAATGAWRAVKRWWRA